MSCRVLKRNVERISIKMKVIEIARQNKCDRGCRRVLSRLQKNETGKRPL